VGNWVGFNALTVGSKLGATGKSYEGFRPVGYSVGSLAVGKRVGSSVGSSPPTSGLGKLVSTTTVSKGAESPVGLAVGLPVVGFSHE